MGQLQPRRRQYPAEHLHGLDRNPQLDPIVPRVDEILLRAEVPLHRLDGRMASAT